MGALQTSWTGLAYALSFSAGPAFRATGLASASAPCLRGVGAFLRLVACPTCEGTPSNFRRDNDIMRRYQSV